MDKMFGYATTRNFKVTRRLAVDKVMAVCVQDQLYTCGSNRLYDQMLEQVKRCSTDEDVIEVARDIWSHSNVEHLQDEDYTLEHLIWRLLIDATITMVEEVA